MAEALTIERTLTIATDMSHTEIIYRHSRHPHMKTDGHYSLALGQASFYDWKN